MIRKQTWRIVGVLEPQGALDFERILRYQLRQGREPVDRERDGRYRRAIRFRLRPCPTGRY